MKRFYFTALVLITASSLVAGTSARAQHHRSASSLAFSVQNTWRDTLYTMTTNTAQQGEALTDTVKYSITTGTYCGPPQNVFLERGTSIIPVTLLSAAGYPETIVVTFQVPPGADTGVYTLVLPGGHKCENDTTVVPNAFTVQSAEGVATSDPFTGQISGLHVSPNPAQDNLAVSFLVSAPSHVRLRIFDALGRTITTLCNRNLGTGPQSFEWLTQAMPAGCYFYELTTGQEMYGGRIVVRH